MFGFTLRALFVFAALTVVCISAPAQDPTADLDRPVAKLTDHSGRTVTIRYVDLLTQLALEPGVKIDPPRKDDIEKALQMVLDQCILERPALEEAAAFDWRPAEDDINKKLRETFSFFPSPTVLAGRLKIADFHSLQDEDFRNVLARRLYIDWYLEVHFARGARPTREIEDKYYHEVFVPEFRRRQPHLLVPSLEEARSEISDALTRGRIAAEIERYLMRARQRVRIEIVEGALDNL